MKSVFDEPVSFAAQPSAWFVDSLTLFSGSKKHSQEHKKHAPPMLFVFLYVRAKGA